MDQSGGQGAAAAQSGAAAGTGPGGSDDKDRGGERSPRRHQTRVVPSHGAPEGWTLHDCGEDGACGFNALALVLRMATKEHLTAAEAREGGIEGRGRNLHAYVVKQLTLNKKVEAVYKALWKPKLGGGTGATKETWAEWVED
eukprot:15325899-Alexandrium_andersonii.AAC.1